MTKYIIKPLVYHPTITNIDELEKTNKGIFPSSLLHTIQDDVLINGNPITFKINTEQSILPVYVIAYEFSSIDNIIYLPNSIMSNSFIIENDIANIELVELPKITKLKLKPIGKQFAREVVNPKELLEKVIVDRYQILNLGDSIYLDKWELIIQEISPSNIVSTFNTDPIVDFLPCREDELEELENIKKRKNELKQIENENHPERLAPPHSSA